MSNTTQLIFNTINSNNRSTSNPQYYIQKPIDNITSYAFNSFNGVNNFNVIDSRNNTLQFSETDTSSTVRVVSIPTGNYTLTELETAIKTGMDSAGTATYTISHSSLTNKITIAGTKDFKILSANNDIYYEIGFVVSTAFAASQIASNIYDLSGLKQIILVSSNFGNDNSILIGSNYTVLGQISVSTPFLGVISYDANSEFIDCQISELSNLSFFMLDERMRILTCTSEWSLSLYVKNV